MTDVCLMKCHKDSNMIEAVIGLLVIGWLLYKWYIWPSTYWKDRGFPRLEYKFPYGTNSDVVKMNKYLGYAYENIYNEMGDLEYAGIISLRRPVLILKDPEIIKAIMVKDFVHFTDRINVDFIKEPLSYHLFNLGGDKWKALRVKLTPTFTSGKLKMMFPLFESCSTNLKETLDKMISTNSEIDVKDIFGRYTTKILGTCAYGIDIDSLGDNQNEFVKIAQAIFKAYIPLSRVLLSFTHSIFPGSERIFKPRFTPPSWETFLNSVVTDTVAYRKKTGTRRNDFIDLLMEIKSQGQITIDSIENTGKATVELTDQDFMAQVFVFLAAGFETSSSVTSYCLYELADNPDIQEKLRKEVQAGLPLTYQSLHEMHYLDMVVHETMRKYPTLPILTRKCTKDYRMPNGAILEKGTRVIIPVYALHHDPKHFPNPSKFDPERFTQDNKNGRHQYCYLPFGEGPRLCIGMRFGLMQTKMGIATLLSSFKIEKNTNTVSPMKFVPSALISTVGHSIKLALKPV